MLKTPITDQQFSRLEHQIDDDDLLGTRPSEQGVCCAVPSGW